MNGGPDEPSPQAERRVALLRQCWERYEHDGQAAGEEALFEIAHPDITFRLQAAGDREIHGLDELRAHLKALAERSTVVEARAFEIRAEGEEVHVRAGLRVKRPEGIADDQIIYVYSFEGDLVTRLEGRRA